MVEKVTHLMVARKQRREEGLGVPNIFFEGTYFLHQAPEATKV
jgi:hypothetical protein